MSNTQAVIDFDAACDRLGRALSGNTRHEIVDSLMSVGSGANLLARLRSAMRAHTFSCGCTKLHLRDLVDRFDSRSRREGLHVLEGWDYKAHKFPDDIIPVLLLDYCERLGIPAHCEREVLAILLDQYFLSILTLLAVRVWDSGDANTNLDRVTALLQELNGADGGGLKVVDDADTLLLMAIAYYNPEESSFDLLMRKARTLNSRHQQMLALPFAGALGSHLRWGLRFMYSRDVARMRDDNVVDYPMLLFALVALLRSYDRICAGQQSEAERESVVEGLLNGLASDPWAFTGVMPTCMAGHEAEYDECCRLIDRHRAGLIVDFAKHEPTGTGFSPLGFSCSFLSNASVVTVALAIGSSNVREQVSLNALFSSDSKSVAPMGPRELLAERMMKFSSERPERLGWGGAPLIVHDERDAVHWYNTVLRTLRS